ncbi:hypothetical protein LB518_09210 [Mesorhizobium sp. BR1-1-16]|uniref:glycine zipper domain-containing protein n=1 Tax=Mesorhizobium sp. BR1-1-16 TaxID=2876653 RepID=UPI001CCFD475|nr:glycine zipper domain-containing protein [Mesorhizobium sp. BR1-1-16]MBZ9936471.1 hypothetical protein [Mesorhizobium sp. BR1-1-16]
MKPSILIVAVTLAGAALAGCSTGSPAGDGAVVGGLAGAAVGGIAGGNVQSAAIGAGVGAIGGAVIADAASKRCYWRDSYGQRHYVPCR